MQGELLCRLGARSHDEHGVIPRHASEDRDPAQRVDIGGNGVGKPRGGVDHGKIGGAIDPSHSARKELSAPKASLSLALGRAVAKSALAKALGQSELADVAGNGCLRDRDPLVTQTRKQLLLR